MDPQMDRKENDGEWSHYQKLQKVKRYKSTAPEDLLMKIGNFR